MWARPLVGWAGLGQADRKSPVNFDGKICVDTEDDETAMENKGWGNGSEQDVATYGYCIIIMSSMLLSSR
jgi:hypothetical protein